MVSNSNKPTPSAIYLTKPKRKSPFKLSIILLLLLIIILSGCIGAFIAYTFFNKSVEPTVVNQNFETNGTTVINNAFSEQAQKLGAQKCKAVFSVLGNYVTNNTNHDMVYLGTEKSVGESPIGALIGQVYPKSNARGSAVVFTSPFDNGCAGVLMHTVLQFQPCTKIAEELPKGSQQLKDLTATAVFHLPTNFNVMLMPASETSCIVVSSVNLMDKNENKK